MLYMTMGDRIGLGKSIQQGFRGWANCPVYGRREPSWGASGHLGQTHSD